MGQKLNMPTSAEPKPNQLPPIISHPWAIGAGLSFNCTSPSGLLNPPINIWQSWRVERMHVHEPHLRPGSHAKVWLKWRMRSQQEPAVVD
jgi:hypothetical protein